MFLDSRPWRKTSNTHHGAGAHVVEARARRSAQLWRSCHGEQLRRAGRELRHRVQPAHCGSVVSSQLRGVFCLRPSLQQELAFRGDTYLY